MPRLKFFLGVYCIVLYLFKVGNSTDTVYSKRSVVSKRQVLAQLMYVN